MWLGATEGLEVPTDSTSEELPSIQPIVVVATAPATTNREVLDLFMSLNHLSPQVELPGLADPDSEFAHAPH